MRVKDASQMSGFPHLGCCLNPSVLLGLVQSLGLVRARSAKLADAPLLSKRRIFTRHLWVARGGRKRGEGEGRLEMRRGREST